MRRIDYRLTLSSLRRTGVGAVKDILIVDQWVRETQECEEHCSSTEKASDVFLSLQKTDCGRLRRSLQPVESPKVVLSLEAYSSGRLEGPVNLGRCLGRSVDLELGG